MMSMENAGVVGRIMVLEKQPDKADACQALARK